MEKLGLGYFLQPLDELSLYLHIPFCTSRCRYCNFYFETGWSPRVLSACLDTILCQSEAYRAALAPKGPPPRIRTVYIGGGTPSVVPPAQLDRFLGRFGEIWGINNSAPLEFAFEANPESLSEELLQVLARHGVGRLSLGVQSLQTEALATLGRRAGRADAERAVALLRHCRNRGIWKGLVNLDLITGIPGQTAATLAEDLDFVIRNGADHVSVYSLTVEPGTSLEQLFDLGQSRPVGSEEHEALWDQAAAGLEAAGMVNYEVSNFAYPGRESRHNLGYWELRPYAGLGPGATGTLPGRLASDPVGFVRPLRLSGPKLFEYARPGSNGCGSELEAPSPRDFFVDHLLTGFRTKAGLCLDKLRMVFGVGADRAIEKLEAYWTQRGLEPFRHSLAGATWLALPTKGRLILDPVLADSLEILDGLGPSWEASLTMNWGSGA